MIKYNEAYTNENGKIELLTKLYKSNDTTKYLFTFKLMVSDFISSLKEGIDNDEPFISFMEKFNITKQLDEDGYEEILINGSYNTDNEKLNVDFQNYTYNFFGVPIEAIEYIYFIDPKGIDVNDMVLCKTTKALTIKEFIDIIKLDLERRAVEFKYIHECFKGEMIGLNYTTDYEFIIWNGKMYRGYIETDVCIDDPEEFKRLTFDFHKYKTEKTLEVLG